MSNNEKLELLQDFDRILGLGLGQIIESQSEPLAFELQKLLDERQTAREAKDFAKSDYLRDLLRKNGVIVEDRSEGQVWKRI